MPSRKTSAPLQRGLACLCCRKRKLKCDGKKPVCTSCLKMKRAEECEYEDRKQKSRTQKLKEKLSMLEERIRELEGPNDNIAGPSSEGSGSSPPGLYDPPVNSNAAVASSSSNFENLDFSSIGDIERLSFPTWPSGSTSSSSDSSVALSRSVTGSPFAPRVEPIGPFELSPFTGIASASFPDLPHWDPDTPLPFENKKMLMDIFLAHRHQCWFDGDISRFDLSGGSLYGSPDPHPALMNAIYLLACHFTRSPYCSELESLFLTRALHEITVALDNSDRLIDVVRASCLLAIYLYANCRILEGYCHSFSAARLAVGLGLHQIQYADSTGNTVGNTSIPIAPPQGPVELKDRISAFWQVFMVDRCWSVANGLPVALPDGEHHQGRIKTPWPEPFSTFGDSFTAMSAFDPSGNPVYMPALKAKAAALYERTFRLSSSSNNTDAYWAEHNATSMALQRFTASLPFFIGYEAWRTQAPYVDVDLFAIHTIANICTIHLQRNSLEDETLQAANYVMSLVRQLSQLDYEFLDPLISACWTTVAKLYIQVVVMSSSGVFTSLPAHAVEQELDVIVDAMKTLSAFFPLAGEHARKIEQERSLIASI